MPRFSVIVPAFRVQAYLHACLDSVLAQSFKDYEIIVVDDCSPDACGPIADEYARRDHRVTALHLPRNIGLGPARNAGMGRAAGDYLIFLDGDDTLLPDALQTIADRIDATDEPDVLMYDYARTYWTGHSVRNVLAAHLDESGPARFRLTDRPELLRLLMVVWNKAYRRAFVEAEGFTFPPGYYEDTPWTYPVLMAADSIAVLDAVCVSYRQRRRGNILSTTSEKHFDVFDQYDRVFAFIDSRPELALWRPVMFRRMLDHFSALFASRDRLPLHSRAAFFRRATASCRRYHAPGAPAPRRALLRHGLMHLGARRTYRALSEAQRLGGRLRKGAAALRQGGAGRGPARALPDPVAAAAAHPGRGVHDPGRQRVRGQPCGGRGEGPRAGPGGADGLDLPARRRPHRADRHPASRARNLRPPDRAGPLGVSGERRVLRPGAGQAAGPDPAPDARGHTAADRGHRSAGPARRRPGHRLRRAAAPGRRLGLLPLGQPALHPRTGTGLSVRVHDAGVRLAAQRRLPPHRSGRCGAAARDARHPGGGHGSAVRPGAPRLPTGPAAHPGPGTAGPGPGTSVRDPRPGAAHRRSGRQGPGAASPDHRRERPPVRGDAGARLGRPAHRLRVADVRLRQPGPAGGAAPRRRRGVRSGPGHVLRHHGVPARRRRPEPGRAVRHLRHGPLAGLPLGAAARRVRARFCPYDDGYAAERVVRRVFLGETDGLPLPVPFSARRTPAALPAQDGAGAAVGG